jgi:hypothetical protein
MLYGVPSATARIEALLSEYFLLPFRNAGWGVLPSGEQTRVSLAKAFGGISGHIRGRGVRAIDSGQHQSRPLADAIVELATQTTFPKARGVWKTRDRTNGH